MRGEGSKRKEGCEQFSILTWFIFFLFYLLLHDHLFSAEPFL